MKKLINAPSDVVKEALQDMAGCSITLLKMDDELAGLWDAPVKMPALRWGV